MPYKPSQFSVCFAVCVLAAASLFASSPSVERIGVLSAQGVSADVKKAVDDKGYRVTLDGGWMADFWFTHSVETSGTQPSGALYPILSNGEFVGVANFTKGFSDFRGQSVSPGIYTLRYQYLPQDANHMGVSPNPDFLLAVPIADDPNAAEKLAFKRLVTLSSKSTGTNHPAVIAMATAGTSGSVSTDDQGMTVLTVEVSTATVGKTVKVGIVVKGQAAQ